MPVSKKHRRGFDRLSGHISSIFRHTVLLGVFALGAAGCGTIRTEPDFTPQPRTPVPEAVEDTRWSEEQREFRENCYDLFNTAAEKDAHAQKLDRLVNIVAEKGGESGKALIDFIRAQKDLRYCIDEMPKGLHGFYNHETETLNLEKNNTDAQMIATMIHEMVHVYQKHSGALDRHYYGGDVHFAMASELAGEAGAETIAVHILHEMKMNGYPDAWDEYKKNFPEYADMAQAYEDTYNEDIKTRPHAEAAQFAAEIAFEQYFNHQFRLDFYNVKVLSAAIAYYAEDLHDSTYTDRSQQRDEIRAMARLPDGINFSAATEALTEDRIFGQGPNATLIRAVTGAFEAYRKGENTETTPETLDKFGILAGVDFKAAYTDFLEAGKAPNIIVATILQAQAQNIHLELRERQMQKLFEHINRQMQDSTKTPAPAQVIEMQGITIIGTPPAAPPKKSR